LRQRQKEKNDWYFRFLNSCIGTKKDQSGPIPPGGRRASASPCLSVFISSPALAALFNLKNNFQQWCLLISINTTNELITD
jgi:hypothetical protein